MTKISNEITNYNKAQTGEYLEICNILLTQINRHLQHATSKIYYGSPVWFIGNNPIVGYNTTKKGINLLFWSGKSFNEEGLVAMGKFMAAQIKYNHASDIDLQLLKQWLQKSQTTIWDYANIIKNKGKLTLVTI